MFSILPQHSFPSVDSLLMFHRSLDRDHRMALGSPLANSGLTEYEPNDTFEEHKEVELFAGNTKQGSDLKTLVDEIRSLKFELLASNTAQSPDLKTVVDDVRSLKSAVALLLDKVQEIDRKIT